jgi:hypothetical protein
MSLLGRLFGSEKERLPLDPSSPGWERMQRHHDVLVDFASKIHDHLEVVPGERVLYAFIGRPPDAFGIAWFEGGEEHNLKSLMKARGLTQAQVAKISDELRAAYVRSQAEPRFEFLAGKKHVLVTPSTSLERDIAAIIHEAGAD